LPAWVALFVGLYALAAGAGEFRSPGGWKAILLEFERSPGLRYLTGMACMAVGAAIYLAVPWAAGDWLAIAVNVVGGIALAEGLLILAAGDRFVALARRLLGNATGLWAGLSAVFGFAAIVAAMSRL
jgi:hypothetical protein